MTISKKLLALVSAVSLCATTSSCASDDGDTAKGGGGYAVGFIGDLSGPYAPLGSALRDGEAAWYAQLNTKGGIDGRKVKFIPLDDANDPTKAIAAAKQLTQSQKVSGIHTFTSNIITAILPVLKQTKTPTIAEAATAELLLPPEAEVFGGDALMPLLSKPMVDVMAEQSKTGGKNMAIMALESASIAELVDGAKSEAKKLGWKIVRDEVIATGTVTVQAQAQAIAAKKPDAVFMALTDSLVVSAVPELRKRGFTGPIVNYQGGNAFSTFKRLQDPGYYAVRPWTFPDLEEPNANSKNYLAAMKTAGLDPNLPYHINGYVHGMVMTEGLRKCGFPCSPSALGKALSQLGEIDTKGLTTGVYKYTDDNHLGPQSTGFYHWDVDTESPVAVGAPADLVAN